MTNSPDHSSPNTNSPSSGSPEGHSPGSDSPGGDASGPGGAGPPSGRTPNPGEAQGSGSPSEPGGPGSTVTPAEWRRLRAPFSAQAYVVETRATGRTAANLPLEAYAEEEGGPNRSVVDLRLRQTAILDRLDLVLGPGRYAYRFEPGQEAGGTFAMLCHLRVGPARRTGVGTGSSPKTAAQAALADAALAFGVGASGRGAGPVVAERESQTELPTPVLKALEQRQEPAPWTPEGTSLRSTPHARAGGDLSSDEG